MFEIQQIPEDSKIFDELKNQQVYFFYFQVNQKYYLFFYKQKSIYIDRIETLIYILDELDRKQRQIRSLRGFFQYVLEIMENGQDYRILKTNLQSSFWRKLKSILRQNKKIALLQFLFGSQDSIAEPDTQNHLNDKIERLQNQVNFLQQKIIQLEQNQTLEIKKTLRELLKASRDNKTIQQDDSTFKAQNSLQSPDLTSNDSKVNLEVKELSHQISKSFSEDSKIDFKDSKPSEQYNLPLNQKKGLNGSNFITLGNLSDDEKIEIIQTGFQR